MKILPLVQDQDQEASLYSGRIVFFRCAAVSKVRESLASLLDYLSLFLCALYFEQRVPWLLLHEMDLY
jgi:hypothetical protein